MYEEITTERLDNFGAISREYETLLRHKRNLINRIGVLHGVDYSRVKVQSGNGSKTTEQEHYVQSLEKINSKLTEYEAWLKPEKEIIKTQIARVKKRVYRKLLVFRYIERGSGLKLYRSSLSLRKITTRKPAKGNIEIL